MVCVKEKTHQRFCTAPTPAFPFPNCGTLSTLLVRDPLHICFWLFLLTLIQQCPTFPIPIYMACSVNRGWLLTAHRDERHAWNTLLVLADGKNKGLHFPKNNAIGRKERNDKKMEVVLGTEMLSQLLLDCLCVSTSSSCRPQRSVSQGCE